MLQMTHPAILQIILRYDKTLFHMVSGSRPKQFLNQNFTANLRHTLHVVVRFIIRYKVLFNYISSFIPNKMYISEWMFQLFLHPSTYPACRRQYDLVFLLDFSGSVEESYNITIAFTRRVIYGLEFRFDRVRVGMATFANNTDVRFNVCKLWDLTIITFCNV